MQQDDTQRRLADLSFGLEHTANRYRFAGTNRASYRVSLVFPYVVIEQELGAASFREALAKTHAWLQREYAHDGITVSCHHPVVQTDRQWCMVAALSLTEAQPWR